MIAIYTRQSVDKKDSISIETQIETCRSKILSSNTGKIEVFLDKGFSGKSAANRPEFQRMMTEVRNKNIDVDEVINNWFEYEMDVKKAVSKKIVEKVILEGEEISIIFY